MAKNILVVEDEPSILKAMAEALRADGFEVQTAVDAERATALIAEKIPDLIMLDLILPGKNGFELLKELKASPSAKGVPVVIMSNLGDEEEVDQGLRLGAADYLIKADYDLSDIVKIIKKHVA
jgi:DNA-binding response OmpR family regulator